MKIEDGKSLSRVITDLLTLTGHGQTDLDGQFGDILLGICQTQLHVNYSDTELDEEFWSNTSIAVVDTALSTLKRTNLLIVANYQILEAIPKLKNTLTSNSEVTLGGMYVELISMLKTACSSNSIDETTLKTSATKVSEFFFEIECLKVQAAIDEENIKKSLIETDGQKIEWGKTFRRIFRKLFSEAGFRRFWGPLVVGSLFCLLSRLSPLWNHAELFGFGKYFVLVAASMLGLVLGFFFLNKKHYRVAWGTCLFVFLGQLVSSKFNLNLAIDNGVFSGGLSWNSVELAGLYFEAFQLLGLLTLILVFLRVDIKETAGKR